MAIYTRNGDDGNTSLASGETITKDDQKAILLGQIDELNVTLGLIRAHLTDSPQHNEINSLLRTLQQLVLTMGSKIAGAELEFPESLVSNLEKVIDHYDKQLPRLKNFIIPGGSEASAHCHQARTQCRATERAMVRLNKLIELDPTLLKFINRLSDTLFVIARRINTLDGYTDDIWSRDDTSLQ